MASITLSTSADVLDEELGLYEIVKINSFSLTFSYILEENETFISQSIQPSVTDSGITITSSSATGLFQDRLNQTPVPSVSYIDIYDVVHTVPTWDDLPLPSDPEFKSLVSYESPTLSSEEVIYTHIFTYERPVPSESETPSTGREIAIIETTFTVNVLNQWDGDKSKVESATTATGSGSGVPSAVLGCLSSGHATYPPKSSTGSATKVFIGGVLAHRSGDAWAPHTNIKKPYDTHSSTTSSGSSKVFIEGKAAARIGDSLSCGGVITNGNAKVLIA